ncbi:MAG: LURP-one-related family protein [Candidatus Hermodarchaeota archaeon]
MNILFCPNCGANIKSSEQNFCEQCGTDLSSMKKPAKRESNDVGQTPSLTGKQPISKPAPTITKPIKGGLFDLNRSYYILKEKYWDWGSGDIMDENGQIIGKMKRKILSIRKKVDLKELDGTVSASIHAKIISARQAQDLKDPEGNLIARIKKKILTFLKPKFFLEAPDGTRWYEAQGNFMGFSFKVKDLSTNKIVAEIEKADRWRDYFLGGFFDFKDTYALRILDNETDRRILLGFVLSIDNVLHDQ